MCGRGEGSNYCATAPAAAVLVGLPAVATLPPLLPLGDAVPPASTGAAVASLRYSSALPSATSSLSSASVLPAATAAATSFSSLSLLVLLFPLSLLAHLPPLHIST